MEIFLNDIHHKVILTIAVWSCHGAGGIILTPDLWSHKSLRNENHVDHLCLFYTNLLSLFRLV